MVIGFEGSSGLPEVLENGFSAERPSKDQVMDHESYVQHDLENLLRQKYGQPFNVADAVLSLQKSKYWRSGENGIIELRRYLSQDQIIYKDIRVVKQGESEDSNEAEFQRHTSFARDKGKF